MFNYRPHSKYDGKVHVMFSVCLFTGRWRGVPRSLVPGPFPASGPRSFPRGRGYPSLWSQVLSLRYPLPPARTRMERRGGTHSCPRSDWGNPSPPARTRMGGGVYSSKVLGQGYPLPLPPAPPPPPTAHATDRICRGGTSLC